MERRGFLGVLASAAAAVGLARPKTAIAREVTRKEGTVPGVYWMRDVPRGMGTTEHGFTFVDMIHTTRQLAATSVCQYPRPIGVMLGRNVYPIAARLHHFELTRDPSDLYFDEKLRADGARSLVVGTLRVHVPWDAYVDLDCHPDRFRVAFERKCGSLGGFTETVYVEGQILSYDEACAALGTDHPATYGVLPA